MTGDPDKDGKVNLIIAGEANGQIFDLEYNGTGNLEDAASWTLSIIYDLYEVAMNAVGVDTASASYSSFILWRSSRRYGRRRNGRICICKLQY